MTGIKDPRLKELHLKSTLSQSPLCSSVENADTLTGIIFVRKRKKEKQFLMLLYENSKSYVMIKFMCMCCVDRLKLMSGGFDIGRHTAVREMRFLKLASPSLLLP